MICILAGQSPYPEQARQLRLSRSGSQSEREIRLILPAHGAGHVRRSGIELIVASVAFFYHHYK